MGLAISEMFFETTNALKHISRQDPMSPSCGMRAPEICENGCIGCVARRALLHIGIWPIWPENPEPPLVDIEWVQKALEIAGEGRLNTIKPDLLGNLINRVIKLAVDAEKKSPHELFAGSANESSR